MNPNDLIQSILSFLQSITNQLDAGKTLDAAQVKQLQRMDTELDDMNDEISS